MSDELFLRNDNEAIKNNFKCNKKFKVQSSFYKESLFIIFNYFVRKKHKAGMIPLNEIQSCNNVTYRCTLMRCLDLSNVRV